MTGSNSTRKSKSRGFVLQDRDRILLKEIGSMRLIDREMAKVVGSFGSTTRANTRLLKLTRAGYLNRFFIGSIYAGRKAIYTLSDTGAVAIDLPGRNIERPRGKTVVGDLFVTHQMAVNQIYLALTRSQACAGIQAIRWRNLPTPISKVSRVIPDGYVEWSVAEQIRASFLEADLGTEPHRIWKEKTRGYLQFATSGDFARVFQHSQFRVLVITNSERRLKNLRLTVTKLTDKIFWFTTFESINREGIWAPVWLRPVGDQRLSLV